MHAKTHKTTLVGTGLYPTKQVQLDSQALIQQATYPKLLCWVKATVQCVVLRAGQSLRQWTKELADLSGSMNGL